MGDELEQRHSLLRNDNIVRDELTSISSQSSLGIGSFTEPLELLILL